ncbi:MAG: DUF4286 family protein [Flavobacteriaceae bacterium]|nr:DUF4286 family protein [Flavobacteriaceae bacterium]
MIYYNLTILLDRIIEVEWINWIKKIQAPKMVITGKFIEVKLLNLILDDPEALTAYATEYFSSSKFLFNNYLKNHISILRDKTIEKYVERADYFRTKLELISEHR